jgi:Ca2+-binding EF-hand superfamily protein
MSFFGLTSFGPESIVSSSLVNSNCFTLFSDKEYQDTFCKLAYNKLENLQTKQHLKMTKLKEFLTLTYKFAPLDDELNTMKTYIGKSDDEEICWDEFFCALTNIRGKKNIYLNYIFIFYLILTTIFFTII